MFGILVAELKGNQDKNFPRAKISQSWTQWPDPENMNGKIAWKWLLRRRRLMIRLGIGHWL